MGIAAVTCLGQLKKRVQRAKLVFPQDAGTNIRQNVNVCFDCGTTLTGRKRACLFCGGKKILKISVNDLRVVEELKTEGYEPKQMYALIGG